MRVGGPPGPPVTWLSASLKAHLSLHVPALLGIDKQSHRDACKSSQRRGSVLLIDLGSGETEWLRMRASWVFLEDLPGIPLKIRF